jgi:hypothetical protein
LAARPLASPHRSVSPKNRELPTSPAVLRDVETAAARWAEANGTDPIYPDEWDAIFADALKGHRLNPAGETLEYLTKRVEMPRVVVSRVVSRLFESRPALTLRQAFDAEMKSSDFPLSPAEKRLLFESLRTDFLFKYVEVTLCRWNDENQREPEHSDEFHPIFTSAVKRLGVQNEAAAQIALRDRFALPRLLPHLVAVDVLYDNGSEYRSLRQRFDQAVEASGYRLTRAEAGAWFAQLRPVLEERIRTLEAYKADLEGKREQDLMIRRWLNDHGEFPSPDLSSKDLRQQYAERVRFERIDAGVRSLVRIGFFDGPSTPPRSASPQPSPLMERTSGGVSVVDLPQVTVVESRSSIDPWIDAVDREFERRLGLPRDASHD